MSPGAEALFASIRRFLTSYLPLQRGASPHTVRSYRTALRQLVDHLAGEGGGGIGALSFGSITEGAVASYLDAVERSGASVSTRNQRLAAIRSFLAYAAAEDVAVVAVLARVQRIPRKAGPSGPVEYLGEAELAALLAQPDPSTRRGLRDLTMLVVLYDTAARIREALGLRLGDLHLGPHPYAVLHGKGGKARSVPLMARTAALLGRYMREFHPERDPAEALFYTVVGGRRKGMSYENAAKAIARYGEMARAACPAFPERLHAHMLRHTRAMHLYQDGVPLSYVKDVLGHANINTTSIYASSDLKMLREAMEPLSRPLETFAPLPDWRTERERLMRLAGLL